MKLLKRTNNHKMKNIFFSQLAQGPSIITLDITEVLYLFALKITTNAVMCIAASTSSNKLLRAHCTHYYIFVIIMFPGLVRGTQFIL